MKTSYFAKYRGDRGCNIAIKPISGYTGLSYPELYPKWPFLKKYKEDGNKEAYTKEYYNLILNKLNPEKVYDDLQDYVLLCYEKPGDFCHRRLVANWIETSLGIVVPEIIYE